jgi:hypothetical protein
LGFVWHQCKKQGALGSVGSPIIKEAISESGMAIMITL